MPKIPTNARDRVLREIFDICTDPEAKPSDRIAAARLFLDNTPNTDPEVNTLHILFEAYNEDYLD